ncbi:MAG: hypothetical protein JSV89_15790 [Spirochaetaceae bacterium]|nr:MAG: hypothetical protein JSV89_15790 [Spirochaetaceae bacterium]
MSDALAELTRSLHEEQTDIETLLHLVAGNDEAVKLIIDGLTFPVEAYRYNCNRLIVRVAETAPESVYPYWRNLAGLLESSNTYHRCSAINVLPHLIPADGGSKFDRMFEKYFGRLDDDSVIPPCYIARNCPTIASHRPDLIQRIVYKLLTIDDTHHEQGRKDLIKADIIQALDALYDRAGNQSEVLRFVEAQLDCSSPKTRKAAKAFLKEHA